MSWFTVNRDIRPRGRFAPQGKWGLAIAKARILAGLGQEQAALLFRRHRVTLARWEGGQMIPNPRNHDIRLGIKALQALVRRARRRRIII